MKKSKLSNVFPNTGVLAFYDQFHQIIQISKYEFSEFQSIKLDFINEDNANKIALFEHELTHWIDHCSTLWGQKNIVKLFNAINAFANQDINEFWRIKTLDNSYRKDTFFHYFSEQYNLIQGSETDKWRYTITSGVRFDVNGSPNYEKPILFVRFSSSDKKPISRVPLTVASILETNAIKAEYYIKIASLTNETNPASRIIRERELKAELINLLYHPELTLYSVVAHLTANLNNDDDIIRILEQTSAIGTLVLNLPEKVYDDLKIPKIDDDLWTQRYKSFKSDKDIGATYYFLLKNLIDNNGKQSFSEDRILSSSNLPNKEDIFQIIISEMQANKTKLIEGPFKSMAIEMITKGIKMFKNRGIFGNKEGFREYITSNKLKPTVLFGDTILNTDGLEISEIIEKLIKKEKLTVHEKYFALDFYDKKFELFNEICGV